MSRRIDVHLLPSSIEDGSLANSTAVIIDVLRASTTICTALAHGANSLVPCESVEVAREQAAQIEDSLLGGERGGVKIEGFDFGNSPADYTTDSVGSRTIVFTTTNGTRAMARAAAAKRILVAAFVNQQATVERLLAEPGHIQLVCAGTNGVISGEDVLFAGSLARRILAATGPSTDVNDAARIAMDFFRGNSENHAALLDAIRDSSGGQNLIRLGYDSDIELAANTDVLTVVPEFDAQSGRITASTTE